MPANGRWDLIRHLKVNPVSLVMDNCKHEWQFPSSVLNTDVEASSTEHGVTVACWIKPGCANFLWEKQG